MTGVQTCALPIYIHFSSLSNFPFRRIDPTRPHANDEREDAALEEADGNAVDQSTPSKKNSRFSKQTDLIALSFTLHRTQLPGEHLSRRARVYSYEIQWGMITMARRNEKKTQAAVSSAPNNLILHVHLILPAAVLRIPIVSFLILRYLACSTLAVSATRLVRSILSPLVAFTILLLSKIGVVVDFHLCWNHRP